MEIVKNDLFDYPNRYIYQLKKGFKFSLDSILLAEYIKLNKNDKILDMCTGNAPVPLILSLKTKEEIVGFEIQKEIFDLAIKSINLNKLDSQIKIINDDINNIGNYYKSEYFSIITCNPPYFKTRENGYTNDDTILSIARHEIKINLEDIFKISFKFLKNNGILYMVHRSNRLDDIIYFARTNHIPVKEIVFVTTKENEEPNTILVKCVKNGKDGIKVKPVVCVENLSTYQHLFK